jgi:hypothetical protein
MGAGADQHDRSLAMQGLGDLFDQPGFTCSRLSADEDQLTRAGPDGGPGLLGRGCLRGPSDKDRLGSAGSTSGERRSVPDPHLPTLTPVDSTVDSQNWLGPTESQYQVWS